MASGRVVEPYRNFQYHILGALSSSMELELELIQPHMAQKPVLRGEVGCACVTSEVSVERGGMGDGTAVQRFECWGGTAVVLFSRSFFSFPWPKTDSIQVMYLALLMVGGYEETDWPM